jgi:hypothetical protein
LLHFLHSGWAWFSMTIGSLISLMETSIEPIIYKILLFDALHRCSRNLLLVRHKKLFRRWLDFFFLWVDSSRRSFLIGVLIQKLIVIASR